MAEEANEQQDALNLDEGQAQEVDIETLKAQAAKADEYKKYADRVTAENKELKKSKDLPINESDSDERFMRLELKTDGYNTDEIDFLLQNGGKNALENPIVLAGIEGMRAKIKSKEASVSGTGKSAVYQKFSERDLKNMPLAELEKIIPQDN